MNLGVLLLQCQEARVTSFTREWTERAVGRVAVGEKQTLWQNAP